MKGVFYKYDTGDKDYIDTSNFGNYYRPRPKKGNDERYVVLIILIMMAIVVLWFGGFLTSYDREYEYRQLLDRICNASVDYVKDPVNKDGIYGASIPGRVIYIRLNELVETELINESLIDHRTGEPISKSTDIKLEVLSKDEVVCSGFAFPEEDRIIPEVFLIGEEIVYINQGETFVDPGAYATDNRDGNITNKIVRTGNVDSVKKGTYYIYYVVKDRAGNSSEKVTRTIVVR